MRTSHITIAAAGWSGYSRAACAPSPGSCLRARQSRTRGHARTALRWTTRSRTRRPGRPATAGVGRLHAGAAWWRCGLVAGHGRRVERSGRNLGSRQKREFMEGFRYRTGPESLGKTMKPDFFKGFPPEAIFERNLVWDTGMIEMFGQDQFERLTLDTSLSPPVCARREHAWRGDIPQSRRAAHVDWTLLPQRTDRAVIEPRVVQSDPDCERWHDAERPQPLLGRDLGVSVDKRSVRHAPGRRARRNEARWPGCAANDKRLSQRHLPADEIVLDEASV